MFENSFALKTLHKYYFLIKILYQHSITHKTLLTFDNFLKNSALNSTIFKMFTMPYKDLIKNSFFHKAIMDFFMLIKKSNIYIKKWVINSKFVNLSKEVHKNLMDNPLNLIGLFVMGLFGSSIFFNMLFRDINLINLGVKLLLIVAFFFLSKLNLSIKKMLSTSILYNLFKWTISYKN